MAGSTEMKLVFRLGGIGFSLPVNLLVEIVELSKQPAPPAAKSGSPLPQVEYRGVSIPVVDVSGRFGIAASASSEALTMLVLHGELGSWGAMVREVEGIRPNGEFEERSLSPLFSLAGECLYESIDVWRGEPLIRFDPERFAPHGEMP